MFISSHTYSSNAAPSYHPAPRPALRPPYLIANSELNTLDSLPSLLHHPKPVPQVLLYPPSVLSPEDTPSEESFSPEGFVDPSLPMVVSEKLFLVSSFFAHPPLNPECLSEKNIVAN